MELAILYFDDFREISLIENYISLFSAKEFPVRIPGGTKKFSNFSRLAGQSRGFSLLAGNPPRAQDSDREG